jgi:hypothetical protein
MLIHPFVCSVWATSTCDPAKSAQTVPLPDGNKLPTASTSTESSGQNLPPLSGICHRFGPTNQSLSCTNFWCYSTPRPGSSPRRRAPSRPRRTRERATDCWSDGGVSTARAATEGEDHSGIFAVTPPSPTNPTPPIKAGLFPSARHPRRAARHCRRRLELVHALALANGQPLP